MTAVIDSGSTGVVVATAVLAAIVAAVSIAALITAVSGSSNSCLCPVIVAVLVAAIVIGSNSSNSDNATVMAALFGYGNSSSRSSTHPSASSVCQ